MHSCDELLDHSIVRTGLRDFGDSWPLENCRALLSVMDNDPRFTEQGRAGAEAMIARAFENRLRHVELLKQHPEIETEQVKVAAVIASLPRTGSTLLHRMLAAVPRLTAPRWFETQNYAPFAAEGRGENAQRRAWGQDFLDQMLSAMPDLLSIHPLALDEADEEIMAMGLLFSSTMIEGTYFVPQFAQWLSDHSRIRVYPELGTILQSWQWQVPERRDCQWILKTPGHLLALDALSDNFPDALIVMTHRDPVEILPSFVNLTYQFYRTSSRVDPREVGAFWLDRLGTMLDSYLATREALGDPRFLDVQYRQLVADPLGEGERVLISAGLTPDGLSRKAMQNWLAANGRTKRSPHCYDLADFGLHADAIRERFARYRERFVIPA